MAITSTQVLSEIQQDLLETDDGGVTWSSGHWTATEVYNYLTRRFSQFLKDSQIVTTKATSAIIPTESRQALPQDWIMGIRVAWRPQSGAQNAFTDLPRVDTWEVDDAAALDTFQLGNPPRLYTEGELPPPVLEIYPPSSVPGELETFSISTPSTFSASSGTSFSPLPDDFVPYLKWGTIADMLAKQGRGQDMARAAYAESRYQEGVQLAHLILSGGY